MRPLLALLVLIGCTPPPAPGDTDAARPVRLGLCDAWDAATLDADALAALDGDVALAADLGLDLVRPHRARGHAFAFSIVAAPGNEGFDWTLPDQVVTAAQTIGVDLLVTIQPFSDARDPAEAPPDVVPSSLPAEVEAWRGFVRAMVERYDGDGTSDLPGLERPVRRWEIGNEPACAPDDAACHQGFLDLVTVTAEVVREADPDALVLAGAAAPLLYEDGSVNASADAVYAHLLASDGLAATDALNVHYRAGTPSPDLPALLEAWRERAGDGPVWLTETASRAPGDDQRVSYDEAAEARWVVEHLDAAADAGVDTVLWCATKGRLDRYPAVTEALAAWP